MAYNTEPVSSVDDVRSKYAQYFEEDNSKSVVSIDTFFQLLMAEMTNQDPLEPTTNTEFVSQLANFTALQTNSDSLYYNTVNYAASLAGKTVTVATNAGTDKDGKVKLNIESGVVTGVDISDENSIEITVNGKRYGLGSIMNVASNPSGSTLSATDGAYAVSLIGKNVTLKAENSEGQTIIDSGVVESIEVENGIYRIVMGGLSYPLDSVIKVGNTAESVSEASSTGSSASASDSTAAQSNARAAAEETRPAENSSGAQAKQSEAETSVLGDSENEELRELFS
ncbi:MAG: hypothetical protein NC394_05670 [Bacteroides sp.]|nr:hypothetical protein [Bacteroides sp.]